MIAALWEIAAVLDEKRVPAEIDNAVWLEIPSKRLRGPGGQNDNRWLRECLERLTGVTISGEYKGSPWGAVLVAEWIITQGGSTVRLSIPTAAVRALRSPSRFAKIETAAIHQLHGHARRLYAILADKKRLARPCWTFQLDELKSLLGLAGRVSYRRWDNLHNRVLRPSIMAINAFGTVHVTMQPRKTGRAITAVRFDWRWKSLDEARRTETETERVHPFAEEPAVGSAPPLLPERRAERELNERKWWNELPGTEQDRLTAEIRSRPFKTFRGLDGEVLLAELPDRFVIRIAYEEAHSYLPGFQRYDDLPEVA